MEDSLLTYLNDHLAGAKFAVSLLNDLESQESNRAVALFSAELKEEIEADQALLTKCVSGLGGESNIVKDAAAWMAQKAGKAKLSAEDPLQLFEAVELLMLGVSGKLALWDALSSLSRPIPELSETRLAELRRRAMDQRDRLEDLRLKLAQEALA